MCQIFEFFVLNVLFLEIPISKLVYDIALLIRNDRTAIDNDLIPVSLGHEAFARGK